MNSCPNKSIISTLTKTEIESIVAQTENYKYRTIIRLAYGSGLKLSEVINLKVGDLDFESPLIHVGQRKTFLPESLIDELSFLIPEKKLDEYVFTSERGGKLSRETIQKFFARCLKKSNVQKPVSFQSLRHSFAVHLLEQGINLHLVQELLGHLDIRLTKKYLKIANFDLTKIKSPW